MDNDFLIRNERQEEYRQVENLVRESFWNIYTPGCTEHYVLHCYRDNPDFIPQLDFVMEKEGKLIGQVIFSKAELILQDGTSLPSWTFGPICIHPDYKRKGYGLRLLNYALEKAREMGLGFLCMEGNIDFYKLAGFQLASNYGIHYHDMPPGEDAPFFLAQELIPDWLSSHNVSNAIYSPPKGYFVAFENPEAFEEYERGFAPKEKLRLPGQLTYDGSMETSRIILRPWRE
ncbi:MAG: N-acetyltransferase, partial [Candidatus Egerieousia sp.]|nr:N-acetyltransferase [Candidatus Egerieousia sp.]